MSENNKAANKLDVAYENCNIKSNMLSVMKKDSSPNATMLPGGKKLRSVASS